MKNLHMWGVTILLIPRAESARRNKAARNHSAWWVEISTPSYRGWYESKGRGEPFDRMIEDAVNATYEGSQ